MVRVRQGSLLVYLFRFSCLATALIGWKTWIVHSRVAFWSGCAPSSHWNVKPLHAAQVFHKITLPPHQESNCTTCQDVGPCFHSLGTPSSPRLFPDAPADSGFEDLPPNPRTTPLERPSRGNRNNAHEDGRATSLCSGHYLCFKRHKLYVLPSHWIIQSRVNYSRFWKHVLYFCAWIMHFHDVASLICFIIIVLSGMNSVMCV